MSGWVDPPKFSTAKVLCYTVTATQSDLKVMINGKLVETNCDATSIQVIIVQSEEGEQMLLKDVSETFLVTPPLLILASKSPTPSQEDDDYEERAESLTADMTKYKV